jgi:thiamine-phosphate pyrophosphorylase
LVDAGVDLIQLREKEMEAGDLLRAGEPIAGACADAGVPFIVNDRPDVALALGAPGVHLGANDLPTDIARRILGPGTIVGRSTHTPEDITEALGNQDPDYIAVGPVFPTPTKPGRPGVGAGLLTHAAGRVEIPWFAIGGIDMSTIDKVLEAGARRVVVVRVITEAEDPIAAAARLRGALDQASL